MVGRLFFIFVLIFAPQVHCDPLPESDVNYAKHRVIFQDGGEYDFYAIRPDTIGMNIVDPRLVSEEKWQGEQLIRNRKRAKKFLEKAAAYIRADAERRGYLEGPSGEHYEKELELLEKGYWPMMFVTPKDKPDEILMTIAYAIRSPRYMTLPFFERFRDNGIPGFPSELKTGLDTVGLLPFFRMDRGKVIRDEGLSLIASSRLWVTGESAEIKFLVSEEERFGFIPVLHRISMLHELHRYSMVDVLPRAQKRVRQMAENEHIVEGVRKLSILAQSHPLPDELKAVISEEIFPKYFFSHHVQPYFMNQNLFVQVSDEFRGNWETSRMRAFVKLFGFPEQSAHSFLESEPWGTAGIKTDIFQMPLPYFEDMVSASLEDTAGFKIENVEIMPQFDSEPNCVRMLSYVAAAYEWAKFRQSQRDEN